MAMALRTDSSVGVGDRLVISIGMKGIAIVIDGIASLKGKCGLSLKSSPGHGSERPDV